MFESAGTVIAREGGDSPIRQALPDSFKIVRRFSHGRRAHHLGSFKPTLDSAARLCFFEHSRNISVKTRTAPMTPWYHRVGQLEEILRTCLCINRFHIVLRLSYPCHTNSRRDVDDKDGSADEATEADSSIGGFCFGTGNPSDCVMIWFGQVVVLEVINNTKNSQSDPRGRSVSEIDRHLDHVVVLGVYHQSHAELSCPDKNLQHIPIADSTSFVCHVDLQYAQPGGHLLFRTLTLMLVIPSCSNKIGSSSSKIFFVGLVRIMWKL